MCSIKVANKISFMFFTVLYVFSCNLEIFLDSFFAFKY